MCGKQQYIDLGYVTMTVEESIRRIAAEYTETLHQRVQERVVEMASDDNSHYLIYQVLGFTIEEGKAMRIQAALQDLYKANNGAYYCADAAWEHLEAKTNINLLTILQDIAAENENAK